MSKLLALCWRPGVFSARCFNRRYSPSTVRRTGRFHWRTRWPLALPSLSRPLSIVTATMAGVDATFRTTSATVRMLGMDRPPQKSMWAKLYFTKSDRHT